jgi:TP901 family phage tail tape measure protein
MGVSNFSIFSKFLAKDGVSPVFKNMTKSSEKFDNRMNSGIAKTKAGLLSLKSTLTTVGVAIAAVATAVPVKGFADWQKGINNVYGLMSQNEIQQFGKQIEGLSQNAIRFGVSIEDANKALFDTISAMGVSEKSFDTYNQALVLAKGGNTDLSTAISGLTAIINAWGKETTDATTAANALFTAQKYGVTNVQELASSIGSVAAPARAAGISMEETLATMAALTKGGIATADATTALRATLMAFVHPSKEAAETLQQYGIASNIVELRQQGLSATLAKLIKLQKEHPTEIAKAIPNIRALNGVLAMNEERMKDVDTILNQIQADIKGGTGLKEAFERMSSGDAATMANAMGALNIAMIQLGKLISPILMPLVKGFGDLVFWLSEMIPKLEPVVTWVIKLGNGFKSLLNFLKPLQVLLPVVTGLLSGLAVYKAVQFFQMMRVQAALFGMVLKTQLIPQILASIPAIWAQTVAILSNPLFWIPAAIAAVVTALVLLWKNWDVVTATIKKFGSTVKSVLVEFWEKCKTVFGAIGSFIKEHFIDILLTALGPIGAIINAIRKMPQILKALHIKGDAFEIKTENENKNPKENPQVKGGKQNGKIEVVTTIDNKTNFKASTNTSLQGSNDLELKPAS